MADLSKVNVKGTVYNLKDATGRTNMDTLLGDGHTAGEAVLGNAAWKDVATDINGGSALITAEIAKNYTDAEVAKIHNFDVVVPAAVAAEIPEGAIYKDGSTTVTGTLAASADTMYKLYLVKNSDAGAGAHVEYITIKSGSTYSWEQIGTTVVDLSNYVTKTTQIAGVAINGGIDKAALQTALELGALAYKDNGKVTVSTADDLTMDSYTPEGTITVNALTQTSTDATLTKAAYTPAGSITGSAISGGSIEVTVKDATSGTAVTDITYESYTPAGTIAPSESNGSFAALKSASFEADDAGVQITGTVSAPNITVTAGSEKSFVTGLNGGSVASFTEGAFTPAEIQSGFYTAGSDASLSAGAAASLTDQTTAKFVKKAYEFGINGSDEEQLDITVVATTDTNFFTDAVTDRGTFTANTLQTLTGGKATVIDTTKFNGGSKAADSFTANVLQGVDTDKVHDTPTAALASAPTFTGAKYRIATESDTALKNVEFSGTAADIKMNGAKYLKQEINAATFSGTAATLGFAGTEVADFQVTGVKYDKAAANGATFAGNAATLTGTINKSDKEISVVFGDAE